MAKLTEEQRQERALNRARKAALEAEERDRRREEQRQRSRGETHLSQEELQDGVLCPGCGEPINDQLGNWPPPAQISEDERRQHEEADARYRERHDQCDSPVRWSTAGSRAEHCLCCCPPPPLNPQAARALLQLIVSAHEEAQKNLDDWDLVLTCDHKVRTTSPRAHDSPSLYQAVIECGACNARRGMVRAVRVGPTSPPPLDLEDQARKDQLEKEIQAASVKLERQRKAVEASERKIYELAAELKEPEAGLS